MQRSSTLILYIQPTMSSRKLFYQDGYFDFFLCEFVHSKHKTWNRTQYLYSEIEFVRYGWACHAHKYSPCVCLWVLIRAVRLIEIESWLGMQQLTGFTINRALKRHG